MDSNVQVTMQYEVKAFSVYMYRNIAQPYTLNTGE